MKVTIAKQAGFCPGVSRAVQLIEKALREGNRPIYCLGELIHNRVFNDSLRQRGVHFIGLEEIPSLPENSVLFIRAHGTTREVYAAAEKCRAEIVDATCPYVRKIQDIAASCLDEEFIIIGDASHPEIRGIVSCAAGKASVYSGIDELKTRFAETDPIDTPATLAVQTTFHTGEWAACQEFLKTVYPRLRIADTICSVTESRQEEVRTLAPENDLTVVVGSAGSSNTMKLFRIAQSAGPAAIMVETAGDLPAHRDIIRNSNNILITA